MTFLEWVRLGKGKRHSLRVSFWKWGFMVYLRRRGLMDNYYSRPLFGWHLG